MNEWLDSHLIHFLRQSSQGMLHGGLPAIWAMVALTGMISSLFWLHSRPIIATSNHLSLTRVPILGNTLHKLITSPRVLITLRLLAVGLFLIVMAAGLFGTPIPERNLATTLTWTIWWSGVIMIIYFTGSSWCAICPWDTLANWLVRQRIWYRPNSPKGLNLRVPKLLRNVWPATAMFIFLSWLELGLGITVSPYATAVLALSMITLATVSLVVFERKAFCRYFCSVGRTIGAYAELSPVSVHPITADICMNCKTLECFHGTEKIESCPTHLVIGRAHELRYCTSCGACTVACPYKNVGWRWQSHPLNQLQQSRTNTSEAWFILVLMSLTIFHGVTMLPAWETWATTVAFWLHDRNQLLLTFSLLMLGAMVIPIGLYYVSIKITGIIHNRHDFSRLFNQFAICFLPITFSYHIAHNLTHLVRESRGFENVILNPFGTNTLPLSMIEKHFRHLHPLLPDNLTFLLQTSLIVIGFFWTIRLFHQRRNVLVISYSATWSILLTIVCICLFSLWLLLQPMVMRM